MLPRIALAWIDHHERHGTGSWDATLLKLMAVVLVAALGVRSGDVARTALHDGCQYMAWRDVRIRLHDGPNVGFVNPRLQDVEMVLDLRFMKEHKDDENEDILTISAAARPPPLRPATPARRSRTARSKSTPAPPPRPSVTSTSKRLGGSAGATVCGRSRQVLQRRAPRVSGGSHCLGRQALARRRGSYWQDGRGEGEGKQQSAAAARCRGQPGPWLNYKTIMIVIQ